MRELLLTLILLLLMLLIRSSSAQSFYDESVPGLRCCDDHICCGRADNNWENDPIPEPEEIEETPAPVFAAPWDQPDT